MCSFRSRISLLLLAGASGGCSALWLTPPPSGPAPSEARPHVDCTTSYLWPIVDSALATYQLAGVAYVATLDDSRFRNYPISRRTDMALGAGFAAAFVGSAVYGYVSLARCRRLRNGLSPGAPLPGVSSATEAPFSRHRARRSLLAPTP